MKFKSMSLMQIVRHIVQVLAFIFFPQLFITVLSSLGDLVTAVIQGSFSLEAMSSQLITVGAVLLITAVWGRFFCGFLCSFGTLQELLFFAAKKIFPRKFSVSPRTDRVLKYLKYVVFAGIAAISDGTYQGEGTGFRGTSSVSVTVENGAIVDITVESYEDDQEFFVRAESSVISEILSAQSLDVQAVSGATFSSNGIIEAVANALNVAFENPNGDAPRMAGAAVTEWEKMERLPKESSLAKDGIQYAAAQQKQK